MTLKEGVAWQEIDGKVVAVSVDGLRAFVFSGGALEVFSALDGHDVVPDDAETRRFLRFLTASGLAEGETEEEEVSHPWVEHVQEVEVLAALCDSARHGIGGGGGKVPPPCVGGGPNQGGGDTCRAFGSCSKPFE